MAADEAAHNKKQHQKKKGLKNPASFAPELGVMSGVTTYNLYKVRDSLSGVLFLVLPPQQWGNATQTVVIGDIDDDSFTYDDSLTHEFRRLLWEVASNDVYHNELDAILVELMKYFTNDLRMF